MQTSQKLDHYILDKFSEPQPASIMQVARWELENPRGRIIAENRFEGVRISTVFTVVNVGPYSDPEWDAPWLFETMVFGGKYDERRWLGRTLMEARANHRAAVNLVFWQCFREYLLRVLIVPASMLAGYILGRGL